MSAPLAEPVDHTLTVEIVPVETTTGLKKWLVIATCTCLGFGRQASCTNPIVANHGRALVAEYHAEHVLRCRAGAEVPEERPSWLPVL